MHLFYRLLISILIPSGFKYFGNLLVIFNWSVRTTEFKLMTKTNERHFSIRSTNIL